MTAEVPVASLYAANLEQLVPRLRPWLTAQEHELAQGYPRLRRRLQYLAGRGLLRFLIQQQWQIPAAEIAILRHDNGAPTLRVQGETWQCSISHSHDMALVAAHPSTPVGVDVEQIKPRKQLQRIQRLEFMRDLATNHMDAFYQRWTLAEAVTKAEQALLMEVLKRSSAPYLNHASHAQHNDYILCCYAQAPKSPLHPLKTTNT
ncbi:hypothetical protein PSI9734_01216 [Pseudidiomarina piscicola]|uniref:4'-phosphopantetheinyl transferase N-terminal domain-containing protein n=1 Tax=Pseudidiomarina piscicola TaxID=2614830 RepID=A0A6S6WUD8_9GAMM|nr:hypothetical protein [Pseudidiomarina piscicola]CAB0150777.1 hypothetical protein PSI9734_01216 [Pseudidiomarina piscicola]VZT40280.1 hypothetical protein PSI9734_01216 [Pseudomonas aeruginosa]